MANSDMSVLQVNKYYYPEVGGIERVVQNIAEGLPHSYTSRVLATNPRQFGGSEQHNGVEIQKTLSLGAVLSVPIAPGFPIRLRTATRDADVVHHHLPNPVSTTSELIVGSDNSALIATYHSDIVRQSTALKIYRPILENFLDRLDRILVTSTQLYENSDILSSYERKCTVIPLSISLDKVDGENWTKINIDRPDPYILFVGRLNYYKGVEYLIDAMKQIDATLLIAGDGERRAALEQRVRDQGVNDRVRFFGYVPDHKLPSIYRTADLFVLPSVEPSEAFGIVQLEAMARELPVVNTSLPTGVPWVSKDGETGLTVPPRDNVALSEAIQKLLEDDNLRKKYGKQARKRVERLFTRKKMIKDIISVYQEVI